MDSLQSQNQGQVNKVGFTEKTPDDGNDSHVVPLTPVFLSPNPSSVELRTLQDHTTLDIEEIGKGASKLTSKYAKYASGPPDGGFKAWSVIIGTALTTCATFGYVNAWGIFQEYYEAVMLPNETPSTIAWIGSVQYMLVFLPGLITGRLFDIGYFKIPYFVGSCLLIVCTFLVAECKEYWQFFLAQGLGTGLACGILFGPALGIVSHWFSKRRGLALGVCAIGSSIGGTVFPIAAQNLIPEVGFKWTMRIFGFILIVVLGVANLTLDRRLPPTNVKGGLFNWAALKNLTYCIYCISGATTFLGLYTMLIYVPVRAIQMGISNDFAFYLVAIANGASAFGRVSAGMLADRVGSINVMAPFIIVSAITTFVWPFMTNKGALIAVVVIYGFSCGTYVSLVSVPAVAMGEISDVGRRTGLFLSFAAFGALGGPPISGAINSATGGFEAVGWFVGGILLFSAFLLLLTRYLYLGKLMGKF